MKMLGFKSSAPFRCLASLISLLWCAAAFADQSFPHIPDMTIGRGTPLIIPFVVEGFPAAELTEAQFQIASSNTNLFPTTQIQLQKTATNFLLQLTPSACKAGSSVIDITLTTSGNIITNTLWITVSLPQGLPFILNVPEEVVGFENSAIPVPLTFSYFDGCSTESNISLHISAANPTLFRTVNTLLPAVTPSEKTILLNPQPGQFGETVVNFTVSDGQVSISTGAHVTVLPFRIRSLPDILSFSGDKLALPLQILVPDNVADKLVFTATSSNPSVLKNNAIFFSGTATNRFLNLMSEPTAGGVSIVNVTFTDGTHFSSTAFLFEAQWAYHPPAISFIPDQSMNQNEVREIHFTAGWDHPVPYPLVLTARSTNPELLPAESIPFTYDGTNATAVLRPAKDRSGSATITFTGAAGGYASSTSFRITVIPLSIGTIDHSPSAGIRVLFRPEAPGKSFQIERSVDLLNWKTVTNGITPASGDAEYSEASLLQKAYFRLRQP